MNLTIVPRRRSKKTQNPQYPFLRRCLALRVLNKGGCVCVPYLNIPEVRRSSRCSGPRRRRSGWARCSGRRPRTSTRRCRTPRRHPAVWGRRAAGGATAAEAAQDQQEAAVRAAEVPLSAHDPSPDPSSRLEQSELNLSVGRMNTMNTLAIRPTVSRKKEAYYSTKDIMYLYYSLLA